MTEHQTNILLFRFVGIQQIVNIPEIGSTLHAVGGVPHAQHRLSVFKQIVEILLRKEANSSRTERWSERKPFDNRSIGNRKCQKKQRHAKYHEYCHSERIKVR